MSTPSFLPMTGQARAADVAVREATAADAGAVARIYNHYVLKTVVTFEETAVAEQEMARRMDDVATAALPWLVAERAGSLVGYAYATRWKPRYGYRHSVEVTIYLDPSCQGEGIGSRLYAELLENLRRLGLRVAVGGIALPNEASVALHEKMGMRKVAHFSAIGIKFGQWIDVGYWQIAL
jgi:L-amino acid N-acyltransferase YncA